MQIDASSIECPGKFWKVRIWPDNVLKSKSKRKCSIVVLDPTSIVDRSRTRWPRSTTMDASRLRTVRVRSLWGNFDEHHSRSSNIPGIRTVLERSIAFVSKCPNKWFPFRSARTFQNSSRTSSWTCAQFRRTRISFFWTFRRICFSNCKF